MNIKKIFNLMLVFVFAFSLLGMPLPVVAQEPTLNHRVTVILDYHHGVPWILGEEWSLGALVTIEIDDPK